MRTLKLTLLGILAVIAISEFSGCTKGDTGPTGATGNQGPSGANGTNGSNGVANISTIIYYVKPSNWDSTTDAHHWVASSTDSRIVLSDSDAIEVYWSNDTTGWSALPVTNLVGLNYGDELSYSYNTDVINFTYYTGVTATSPPSSYPGFLLLSFKVVVIPPTMQLKHPNTNWKNPMEVAKLPEVQQALNSSN